MTNTSCVSVPNQFPVVKADDTTDGNGPGNVLENIFFFQTITHGKLTTGSYFRGGGCRATDSSCSPVNCHSPRAAPPPLLCGCWQVVVLSYQGRHASLGPP